MDTKSQLEYEETPPIEPVKEPDVDMFPPPKPRMNFGSIMTAIIVFALLFIVGFWLSGTIRKYIGTFLGREEKVTSTPTPSPEEKESGILPTATEEQPSNIWKTYQVLNGRTRIAYEGISFQLPSDVLPPTCDGSSCRSQGTYLPGGTRFTVALRGEGQVLPDYRGKVISDLTGIPFPIIDTAVGGKAATEFSGIFIGKTVSGFIFTQMRGVMVPITETVSLEINHFSPQGATVDFASDDILFDEILLTFVLPSDSLEKGGVITPTSLPTGSASATPSPGE